MAIVQELSPRDCLKRLHYGQKMEAVLQQNDDLIFFMSDEAHFKLNITGLIAKLSKYKK